MMDLKEAQRATLLIRDVRIFTGEQFIERGYVFSVEGKISKIAAGEPPHSLQSDTTVSTPGDTLLPGLIDAHIHGEGGEVACIEQPLRFGVTTVCDMQNELEYNEKLRGVTDMQ